MINYKYLFVWFLLYSFGLSTTGYSQVNTDNNTSPKVKNFSYSIIAYPVDITFLGEIRSSVIGFEVSLLEDRLNVQAQIGPAFRPKVFARYIDLVWGYSYGMRLSVVGGLNSSIKLLPYLSYRYTSGATTLNIFEEDPVLQISRSIPTKVRARQIRYMVGGSIRVALNSFVDIDFGLGFGFLDSRIDSPRAIFGPNPSLFQFVDIRPYNEWHRFIMVDGFLGLRIHL